MKSCLKANYIDKTEGHLALTKETVEEDVVLPHLSLETPNQPLQNDSLSTQENPPQEVTGGDIGIKIIHPASKFQPW